jgi:hypothetical protein
MHWQVVLGIVAILSLPVLVLELLTLLIGSIVAATGMSGSRTTVGQAVRTPASEIERDADDGADGDARDTN